MNSQSCMTIRQWRENNKNEKSKRSVTMQLSCWISIELLLFGCHGDASDSTCKQDVLALGVSWIKRVMFYVCRSLKNGASSQFRTSYYEMVLVILFNQHNLLFFGSFGRNPYTDSFILWQCTSVINIANVHKLPGLLCKMTHDDV